jgi:hypothetical protein
VAGTDYWLLRWVDSQGVRSPEEAERALRESRTIDSLRDAARMARAESEAPRSAEGNSILAGAGLNLSGALHCIHEECRRREVDRLLRHVWHYFDRVIVDDAAAVTLEFPESSIEGGLRFKLLQDISVALYLRRIGVLELIEFRRKHIYCQEHWIETANLSGLTPIIDSADHIVAMLSESGNVKAELLEEGDIALSFSHPLIENPYSVIKKGGSLGGEGKEGLPKVAASMVFNAYFSRLISDLATARHYGLPLGSIRFHGELLKAISMQVAEDNIAFDLQLPILDGVPAERLIAIRNDEREHFERFKQALQLAMRERLKTRGSERSADLAKEIRTDVIEPELRRIHDRLAIAGDIAQKKVGVGVGLGIVSTVCGLFLGLPMPMAGFAGVATILGTTGPAVSKLFEDKAEIQLSDMYFVWRASGQATEAH